MLINSNDKNETNKIDYDILHTFFISDHIIISNPYYWLLLYETSVKRKRYIAILII